MKDKTPNLETSLAHTIKDASLEIGVDLAEAVLDERLQEGLVREIPVVGSLIKIAKAGVTIKDYIFTKKLFRFLQPIQSLSDEQKKEFTEKIETDNEYRQKVGETIMVIIDRLDNMQKPELIGNMFKAYILGEIDFEMFRRLSSAIDRVFLSDLHELALVGGPEAEDSMALNNLVNAGLVGFEAVDPYTSRRGGRLRITYHQTELGETLVRLCRKHAESFVKMKGV